MERIATGAALDRGLVRFAAIAFGLFTLALLAWGVAHRTGTLDAWGRPLGSDFSGVYAAGRLADEGRAPAIYDFAAERAEQEAVHGGVPVPFYPWHYPPVFLIVAAPLAALPYLPALIVWQFATLASALAAVRAILPDPDTLLVALGSPIVFVCIAHGQNGFLTAALFGGGLLLGEQRPVLGGVLLGCLCYKPHLALVVPLALAVGGWWRALAAAAASACVLAVLSALLFGVETWSAFVAGLPETRRVTIEDGGTGWYKLASLFAYLRMLGGSFEAAATAQAAVTAAVLVGTAWLWRAQADASLRAAALMLGSLLATPYVVDYDLVLIGPAVAFLVRHGREHGFLRWDAAFMATAWFVPLVARHLAFFAGLPAAWAAVAALYAVTLRRAFVDVRQRTPASLSVS